MAVGPENTIWRVALGDDKTVNIGEFVVDENKLTNEQTYDAALAAMVLKLKEYVVPFVNEVFGESFTEVGHGLVAEVFYDLHHLCVTLLRHTFAVVQHTVHRALGKAGQTGYILDGDFLLVFHVSMRFSNCFQI